MSDTTAQHVPTDDRSLSLAIDRAHRRYRAARPVSQALDERARRVLPGGGTRTVLELDPFPIKVERGSGARVVDADGLEYVDLCGNSTAGLLGHDPRPERLAIEEALDGGWSIGATHAREAELAELVCARFDSIEQVRFTSSGTEANLMALGLARHATGRSGVGLFTGGYHGGVLAFDHDVNPLDVPHRFVVAPYDDIDGLDELFADDLTCVVVEAVQGAGGYHPARPEFLRALRERCDATGALLVLDEVMTSRLHPGGAQQAYGVRPDLTTLGKYLGAGMSFGAFGGRRDLMAHFDRRGGGELVHAGTFNNDVVSMAAAIATLRHVLDDGELDALDARADRFRPRLHEVLTTAGLPLHVTGTGSMLTVHADRDSRWRDLLVHALLEAGFLTGRSPPGALPVRAPRPAARPPLPLLELLAGAPHPALAGRRAARAPPRRPAVRRPPSWRGRTAVPREPEVVVGAALPRGGVPGRRTDEEPSLLRHRSGETAERPDLGPPIPSRSPALARRLGGCEEPTPRGGDRRRDAVIKP